MAYTRADDIYEMVVTLSGKVDELRNDVKVLEQREVKLIKRLLDAEEMIEQLGEALMRRR